MSDNLEFKVGKLTGELEDVKKDIEELTKSVNALVAMMTKGKGIFIGMLMVATTLGASFGSLIDNIKEAFK